MGCWTHYSAQSVRGVAQSGSASGSGPEGREFESRRPDHPLFLLVVPIVPHSLTGFAAVMNCVGFPGESPLLGKNDSTDHPGCPVGCIRAFGGGGLGLASL